MSGWIVVKRTEHYGPFRSQSAAVVWAEKKLGTYIGGDWWVTELWAPNKVDG